MNSQILLGAIVCLTMLVIAIKHLDDTAGAIDAVIAKHKVIECNK